MSFYDVSLQISNGLVVWPGDPQVSLTAAHSITEGDKCNITMIQLGAHAGTHIDAPYHFLNNGATIDAIPIETFVGPCFVIELGGQKIITKGDLKKHNIPMHSRVILKTKNSKIWGNKVKSFKKDYIALGISAAQYLVEISAILVGIDYLSIEPFESQGNPVHKLLLENNIPIIEGLNLSNVKSGEYELICLPLKLQLCEAAPARVLLRDNL